MYNIYAGTAIIAKKSKITKILNSEENSKRKVSNQMANANDKDIKRVDNNCHISDLVREFPNLENGGLKPGFIARNFSLVWQSHDVQKRFRYIAETYVTYLEIVISYTFDIYCSFELFSFIKARIYY